MNFGFAILDFGLREKKRMKKAMERNPNPSAADKVIK